MEVALVALCALIVAKQLFLPGFIGLGDEGDIPKIAGRVQLNEIDDNADRGKYFQPLYVRASKWRWNSGIPSSELLFAYAAAGLERRLGDRRIFDIRWVGAFHAIVFLACFWLILILLRPLPLAARILLSLFAVWVFADSGLITYLNSFYMDTPALLGGLAVIALGTLLLLETEVSLGLLIAFGVAAVIFATSKSAHAPAALLLAGFAAAMGWRSGMSGKSPADARGPDTRRRLALRVVAGAIGAAILAASVWMFVSTPKDYKAQAEFDVLFFRIATPPARMEDLRQFHLDDTYLRYAGMHSFVRDSPMRDSEWVKEFCWRTSPRDLFRFYLHHPERTVSFLWSDLARAAWLRRAPYMGNFTRASGMPPRAIAAEFGTWSLLTERFYRAYPASLAIWQAGVLMLSMAALFALRDRYSRAIAGAMLGTSLLACVEYAVCSLGDVINTERHLIVFHLFNDATIFLFAVLLAGMFRRGAFRRPFQSPNSARRR